MRMRKKKHGDERITLLSSLIVQENNDLRNVNSLFVRPQAPLCIEIGCGKGDFICKLSQRNPDVNYLAVEKCSDAMIVAVEKYAVSRGLGSSLPNGGWQYKGTKYLYGSSVEIDETEKGNVLFISSDCKDLFEFLPPHSVQTIYLNFSDPWPKKGNADRRLTHPTFLREYRRLLALDGTLEFKTDNVDLFQFTLESLKEMGYSAEFVTTDLHHSERAENNIETEYEHNFAQKGFLICAVTARP